VTRSYGYEGPKADIWASGVTLFFMVAGKLPFIAEDRSALFQKVLILPLISTTLKSSGIS